MMTGMLAATRYKFIFLVRLDGGNTWNDVQVSDHTFAPSVISGYNSGYQGDYIGITSSDADIVPLWMDNYSGIYQAWTSNVMVIGINNNNNQLPSSYLLAQNYPNPFNPSTSIRYSIPHDGMISFSIFDILGRELYHINEFKKTGFYEVKFDGSNYTSGLYFYKMASGNFSETKKMILIK